MTKGKGLLMKTDEIMAMRRAEMRLMEMGALAEALLSSPSTEEEIVRCLRGEFRIMVKTTREIRGTIRRYEDGSHSANFIQAIKWVRESTRRKVGKETTYIMGLSDAKALVESWIGQTSFEIPLEWDLSLYRLPTGFKVL